ncbi:MAG: HNH endonuclease [Proteobacteria bacterium]|nr:HNH endonuclease [Pseudomonadota bacterium]
MIKFNRYITHNRLLELLVCDPETGIMKWKIGRPGPTRGVGSVAGVQMKSGYWRICLDGHRYRRHNLVWFYVHGKWPKQILDHRDRNPGNDAIGNLREANMAQNQYNNGRKGKSGLKGVGLRGSRWCARITVDKKTMHLGLFDTKELAHQAYKSAAKKFFGDFACA